MTWTATTLCEFISELERVSGGCVLANRDKLQLIVRRTVIASVPDTGDAFENVRQLAGKWAAWRVRVRPIQVDA